MTFTETFTINALAPFDFDLTASNLLSAATHKFVAYANGEFHQVLEINEKPSIGKIIFYWNYPATEN